MTNESSRSFAVWTKSTADVEMKENNVKIVLKDFKLLDAMYKNWVSLLLFQHF